MSGSPSFHFVVGQMSAAWLKWDMFVHSEHNKYSEHSEHSE